MIGISRLVKITVSDFIVRTAYQMGKTPLLPIFAASLGASATFLGLIVSISTVTGMCLKPFFGLWSDRSGRWAWLFIGTLIFTVMPFFYQLTSTTQELLVLRLIHGLATAIYGPVTLALVIEQCQEHGKIGDKTAERLGWFGVARIGGYLLGPTIAALLLTEYTPQTIFTFIGLLSSCAFFPVLLLKDESDLPKIKNVYIKKPINEAFLAGIKTPELWLTGGLEFVVYLGFFATKTFLPLYAIETGISIIWIGLFFSTQELTHLLTRPLGGRLSDRFGYLIVASSGMVLASCCFVFLPFIQNSITITLLAVFLGISQAMIFPSTLALFAENIDTKYIGTGVGIIGTLKNSGKIFGPIIGGLLINWHDYKWMFWCISILLALLGFVILFNELCGKTLFKQEEFCKNFSIHA